MLSAPVVCAQATTLCVVLTLHDCVLCEATSGLAQTPGLVGSESLEHTSHGP